jgi:hypothetical protein
MRGAIHSLPQYTFMAWCSVESTGQLQMFPMRKDAMSRLEWMLKKMVVSNSYRNITVFLEELMKATTNADT